MGRVVVKAGGALGLEVDDIVVEERRGEARCG